MCGNVGVVLKHKSGFYKQVETAFQELLYVGALRGEDSTGIIGVENDGSFHIMKEASESSVFLPKFKYGTLSTTLYKSGRALIGHNRKKTIGGASDKNAHPFVVDETFAMVHNGTLFSHEKLAKTEVDSEALAIHLAKAFSEKDHIRALEGALEEVNGAYAVAFYDQKKHGVCLLRNKERPLWTVETSNAWYWASEGHMLLWILARNGYTQKELDSIKAVPEDTLITFDLEKGGRVDQKLNVKKPVILIPPPTSMTVTKFPAKTTTSLSKNEYKRIRKNLIGSRVEFWVQDYLEADFPNSSPETATEFNLMGVVEEVDEDNIVHAKVDIAKLNIKLSDLGDSRWYGTIYDMAFDPKGGTISLYVNQAKPLPFSVKKKPVIVDSDYIQRKLDEQERQKTLTTLH